MKKSMKKTTIFAIILSLVLLLTSCGSGSASGAAEVVSSDENACVISVSETSGTLYDVMNSLKEAGELDFSGSESEYGFFVESVNGAAADASANQFWAVYTTLGELDGVSYSSSEYGSYDYDGKTLASASYGVSGLPAVEGELYALVLESY